MENTAAENALAPLRREIDLVDGDIARLFAKRMALSLDIARVKEGMGLPVRNAGREARVLSRARDMSPEGLSGYTERLFALLMKLSAEYQSEYLTRDTER